MTMLNVGDTYTDEDGTWLVTSRYGRALIEPSDAYEAAREAERNKPQPEPPEPPLTAEETRALRALLRRPNQ